MTPRLVRLLAAATPLVAAVVFAHAVCGALFSCGCVAFSMAQCSIHSHSVGVTVSRGFAPGPPPSASPRAAPVALRADSLASGSLVDPRDVALPPCPWCTGRVLFPLALALWSASAGGAGWLTRRHNFATTFAASVGAVLLAILLSGALTVALTGYPTLLGFAVRGEG